MTKSRQAWKSLLDNPGVLPGPAAEQSGVLKAAGQMFQAQRRHRGWKIVSPADLRNEIITALSYQVFADTNSD
jgi:hypothetical protein